MNVRVDGGPDDATVSPEEIPLIEDGQVPPWADRDGPCVLVFDVVVFVEAEQAWQRFDGSMLDRGRVGRTHSIAPDSLENRSRRRRSPRHAKRDAGRTIRRRNG